MSKAARDHIRATIAATAPAAGMENAGRFEDADRLASRGAARDPLELLVGRSRVFELEQGQAEKVRLSNASPTAFNSRFPVRVRYDAPEKHNPSDLLALIEADQVAIVRALYLSAWSASMVVLNAAPGQVEPFLGAQGVSGYVSNVDVFISYDVT